MTFKLGFDIGAYAATIRKGVPGMAGQAIAEALEKTDDGIAAAFRSLSAFFKQDAQGNVSVDTIAIRNIKVRYFFDDLPDIQNVATAAQQLIVFGKSNRLKNTSGGNLTMTGTPTIAPGKPGQEAIFNNYFANNIVLQDRLTLANSGLFLAAATRTLAPRSNITLRYSLELLGWVEHSFAAIL